MEKRNLFVSGKAVVAAVCGAFTAAFGWLGWLVVAWAACMALDWVSGSAAAASRGKPASSRRDGQESASAPAAKPPSALPMPTAMAAKVACSTSAPLANAIPAAWPIAISPENTALA